MSYKYSSRADEGLYEILITLGKTVACDLLKKLLEEFKNDSNSSDDYSDDMDGLEKWFPSKLINTPINSDDGWLQILNKSLTNYSLKLIHVYLQSLIDKYRNDDYLYGDHSEGFFDYFKDELDLTEARLLKEKVNARREDSRKKQRKALD